MIAAVTLTAMLTTTIYAAVKAAGSFVTEADGTHFTDLPVHDAPVMVAERAAVPFE